MDPNLLTTTQAVNSVFIFILGASLVLLLGITATMVWFVIRYHRSRAPEPTSRVDGNLWLETVWITLPVVLVMAMFWYGWAGYLTLRDVPKVVVDVARPLHHVTSGATITDLLGTSERAFAVNEERASEIARSASRDIPEKRGSDRSGPFAQPGAQG